VHDEAGHRLVGREFGLTFRLGDAIEARLVEANPLTGGIIFELMSGIGDRRRRRQRAPRTPGGLIHRRR
jgi:ribonuclease R